ncbi:MAG: response regulator transcription factor [Erythrobacter sp.]
MRDFSPADRGLNILLVEDDAGIARFIRRGLEAHGYEVEWQTLGARARPRLASGLFDAAILDLGLPDADGAQLCREARAAGVDLPIFMLTARAELADKLEGFRCGADDYLTKPFAMDELLVRLSVMIMRKGPRHPARLIVGELVIDPAGRSAAVAGNLLDLSRREFDLLHYLAQHAGEVAPRTRLLDEVWGGGAEITPNTVDVYVGYLRRHLAQYAGAPRLETVRGIGFVLRH